MNKKIIFTGGGTAGHVTPNIALIKKFQKEGWQIYYLGSENGIEKELIEGQNIPFYAISSGKLRRYFSWQNFIDPFKIFFGVIQAFAICLKLRPNVVFSKGGFVSFPVVVAAWLNRIPVIIHESDLTPGLANKLSFPFADKICVTFPETLHHIKNSTKATVTGTPIREEFFSGDKEKGRQLCGFSPDKKTILVYGGSQGAESINKVVRQLLPEILDKFQIVHVCGKNNCDASFSYQGYKQFEYLSGEFPHILALADLVIARSGANSIYELLALQKPHILIPLGRRSSRGDQIENAKYFANLGFSQVIFEEELTKDKLNEKIIWAFGHLEEIKAKLASFTVENSVKSIYELTCVTLNKLRPVAIR